MTPFLARLCLGGGLLAVAAGPIPAFEWTAASPESQGMSAAKLAALRDDLAKVNTQAVFVVRNDAVVLEWYAPGRKPTDTHHTASLAKALVGGVPLALAMDDGLIRLDDPAAKFVPEWAADPRKGKITIRMLGSHTSGLEDSTRPGVPKDQLGGWAEAFWKRLPPPDDPFTLSRDRTPLKFGPGTDFQYSNPGIAMLGYAVTAAIKGKPHSDIRTLLRERVMKPVGVPDNEWSVGYGKAAATEVGGLPQVGTWGGGNFSPRAAARVGRLMLREGDWDGKRLLDDEAVRATVADAGTPGPCGMGWWTNADGRYKGLPRDAYWGHGAGDQTLVVVPSLNLVAVRFGGDLEPKKAEAESEGYVKALGRLFLEPLAGCVNEAKSATAPYPPSRVITTITWAPKESIARTAKDSDIWAMTWADDGHLYTAYGDGTGFPPKVVGKLSQGLARVEGGPGSFTAVNLRSPTFEALGDGAKGRKTNGMVMVEGVLYALVRNAGNSQLGWSADRGKSWEWADWKFTQGFGCPTFLQFGPNYAGARDEYVYVYSPDRDSAYVAADRVVLARVPKDKLRERAAWEFLTGVGPAGPAWSRDQAACGAAFAAANGCYRSTVSFNPGLKRYLLVQAGADRTAKLPFGIYDAPEPWGPWTTVTHATGGWDVNPGETASLPPKWMSGDGATVHLVYSGDDAFNVRRAMLTVAP